jgi:hypothetical protein
MTLLLVYSRLKPLGSEVNLSGPNIRNCLGIKNGMIILHLE